MERVLKECCSTMGSGCINFIRIIKSKYLSINMFLSYISSEVGEHADDVEPLDPVPMEDEVDGNFPPNNRDVSVVGFIGI